MLIDQMFKLNQYDSNIFIQGTYTDQYFMLIEHAINSNRSKKNGQYYESHHIIPKSLQGSNHSTNLILLTAQEHFTCHTLLINMTTGKNRQKMCRALFRIVHGNKHQKTIPVDAEQYALLREQISKDTSFRFKGCTIPEERKQRISKSKQGNMSMEHKSAISKAQKGKVPWNKGFINQISNETREKIRNAKLGKKRPSPSDETKLKMSMAHKGKKPWNDGVTGYKRTPHSEETKAKIRNSRLRTEMLRKLSLVDNINMPLDVAHV